MTYFLSNIECLRLLRVSEGENRSKISGKGSNTGSGRDGMELGQMIRKSFSGHMDLLLTQSQDFSEAWCPYPEVVGLQQVRDLLCLHIKKSKDSQGGW